MILNEKDGKNDRRKNDYTDDDQNDSFAQLRHRWLARIPSEMCAAIQLSVNGTSAGFEAKRN